MSIYPIVVKQYLNKLREIAEQQQNWVTIKIEIKSKKTHNKKLAEIFEPITKKLEDAEKSTKKLWKKF